MDNVFALAIVGSREFKNLKMVEGFVRSLPSHVCVVSGGAKGVDKAAETAARKCGLETDIKPAEWNNIHHPDAVVKLNKWGEKYDITAGFRRNKTIVDAAHAVVAFWDGESAGTYDTIAYAQECNKPVHVVLPSGDWRAVLTALFPPAKK